MIEAVKGIWISYRAPRQYFCAVAKKGPNSGWWNVKTAPQGEIL